MEKGEKINARMEEGIELATYKFSSNLGEAELVTGWSKTGDKVGIDYTLWFVKDGKSYHVRISPWNLSKNDMYTTLYSFR